MSTHNGVLFLRTGLLAFTLAAGMSVTVAGWGCASNEHRDAEGEEHRDAKSEAAEGDEVVINLAAAPAAVRTAFTHVAPVERVTKVIKEEDEGIITYEVEYTDAGMLCSAVFSRAGDLMELEKGVGNGVLSSAAMTALNKEFAGATFSGHTMVQKFYYEVDVVKNGKKHTVKVDAAGNIEDEHDETKASDGKKGEKEEDEKEEHKK